MVAREPDAGDVPVAPRAGPLRPIGLLGAVIGLGEEANDYAPFLRWLIFNCVAAVGFLALWRLGLIQIMLETDRTHMSLLILALLLIMIAHCLVQTLFVSRELTAVRRTGVLLAHNTRGFEAIGSRVRLADGPELEPSVLTRHIANLVAKSRAQGSRPVDQTLLLRSLADQLRAREKLGWFVAEALLRLALLGTAVGFILMLIPIAGLTSFDVDTLRNALAGMSSGMAVALNVTVTGIAAALLLKVEYYFLDQAIGELFARITEATEVHVVSVLGRPTDG